MKLSICMLACFLMFGHAGQAQTSPLWNTLRPGPYKIGFQAAWRTDYSRTWGQSDFVREDYSSGGPYGRPVRISMWYPAKIAAGIPVKMRDYLYIRSSDPASKKAQAIIETKDL